jgi:hypothetical protein
MRLDIRPPTLQLRLSRLVRHVGRAAEVGRERRLLRMRDIWPGTDAALLLEVDQLADVVRSKTTSKFE